MGLFSKETFKRLVGGGEPQPPTPRPQAAPGQIDSSKIRPADIEVLLADLAAGADYQKSLVPQAPPEITGYEFGLLSRPARTLSGDFHDFIAFPDGRFGIAVADASGKGIPAALLTMTCRAFLRTQPEPEAGPARALTQVNRMLAGNLKRGMFVTGVYGVLDPMDHTLTVANAGHLPVVVWRSKAKIATVYPSKGPALGVLPAALFEQQMVEEKILLAPGDRFIFLTDGVNEAMAPGQKEFGMEHLRKRLQAESDLPSANLLKDIGETIELHRGGGEQSDDITIVTGRRLPS